MDVVLCLELRPPALCSTTDVKTVICLSLSDLSDIIDVISPTSISETSLSSTPTVLNIVFIVKRNLGIDRMGNKIIIRVSELTNFISRSKKAVH